MKVSFDFDSTLTIDTVQDFARKLVEDGHEVWIVTQRFEFKDSSGNSVNNKWVFEIAEEVGIKRENIHFCNMRDKFHFFIDKDFLFHLDDDIIDLDFIRTETNVFPVWRDNRNDWKNQCKDLIRILSK